MDAIKRNLFLELWLDIQDRLRLSSSVKSFLDYLQSRNVFNSSHSAQYYSLVEQNRQSLFQQLTTILTNRQDGYDILLDFLKKPEWIFLYDKYQSNVKIQQTKLYEINKALKYGNVPSASKFYIERSSVMQELKAQLLEMDTTYFTNIYGMDGSGKTNLVAACLRDHDILLKSKFKVYWIDVSRFTEHDLLDRLYQLYHKIQIDDNTLSDLPKEKPNDIYLMKDHLQALFLRPAYVSAIIVLDNVVASSESQYITYFNVCKLVIISQEKVVSSEYNINYIHLQDTFNENETMEVFKVALKSNLLMNDHLQDIIDWCRGDPITINLCANHMADRRQSLLKSNSGIIWKTFKGELCQYDSKIAKKRSETIQLRLQDLDRELYEKYLELAIFEHDVNITTNVLCLLWNLDIHDVEEIMIELCNKSFAVREFNPFIESYVFGVNPIYLNYLKSINTKLPETHRKLIDAYKAKYFDYHKFHDDNYIYQYIGYHLKNAHLVDDFKIYFDLKFLGAKIKATGIADVLSDFVHYADYITRQVKNNENILQALSDFVKTYGHNLERYPRTNIVQSALQLPKENLVHEIARVEMMHDPSGLYFECLSPKRNKYHIHELSIQNNLQVACFTRGDSDYLLVGTETGDIQLWDQHFDRVIQEFKGHSGPITYLRAADHKFLSISKDGTVKVWKLDHKSRRNSVLLNTSNNSDTNVPSPARIKQKNYQHFFGNNFDNNCDTYYAADGDSVISADFTNDLLVAGTESGKLMLWLNDIQQFEKEFNKRIISVQFSRECTYIYMASGSDVHVYNSKNFSFIYRLCCKGDILALHTLHCETVDKFIAILDAKVLMCTINNTETINMDREIIMQCADNSFNTCSSMIDKYLVIGSSDNKINMWDLQKKCVIEELNPQNGNVICIDATTNTDDNSIEILLTGFQDKSLKLWHINPDENSLQQSEMVNAFAAYWQSDINEFATAIARKNKLSVVDARSSSEIVTSEAIFKIVSFKKSFVYGLENGKVYLYQHDQPRQIMNLNANISYLEALDNMVVAATHNGIIFVYYKGEPKKILEESGCSIKNCFDMDNTLIVISQRKIFYWDYDFARVEILHANVIDVEFNVACLSTDNCLLCVTFGHGFKILTIDAALKISACVVNKANDVITASCFSSDNKYLALGTQKGDIEVWIVDKLHFHSTLVLHESPVRFLTFSPRFNSPILLSLSEQMAWWDLKEYIPDVTVNSHRSSFRCSKQTPLSDTLSQLRIFDRKLLCAIKLHGTSASHIVNSDNFQAFYCIDNLDGLYNLRQIHSTSISHTARKTVLSLDKWFDHNPR